MLMDLKKNMNMMRWEVIKKNPMEFLELKNKVCEVKTHLMDLASEGMSVNLKIQQQELSKLKQEKNQNEIKNLWDSINIKWVMQKVYLRE